MPAGESAALIALLRSGTRPWREYRELLEASGSALTLLECERGRIQRLPRLFHSDDEFRLDSAAAEISTWRRLGIRVLSVLDADYPDNLRAVHDRPAVIFVAGSLLADDRRSVAVIGSRDATAAGTRCAGEIAQRLIAAGYTVVSGLAAGIDTAAHTGALTAGGRTIAVIGTGLTRAYPPQNAALQRRITAASAVVSQFWPDAAPARRNFPIRNALMSGLSLATVIVEASATSGARSQARSALAHGRPVVLIEALLEQAWARELSRRSAVHVARSPAAVVAAVEHLCDAGPRIS